VLAVLLPRMHDDLGVRGRSEPVAAALEVRAQRGESVDLAVEGDVHRAVLVADGLIAGDEVDHAQPCDAERGGTVDVIAEVSGPRCASVRTMRSSIVRWARTPGGATKPAMPHTAQCSSAVAAAAMTPR